MKKMKLVVVMIGSLFALTSCEKNPEPPKQLITQELAKDFNQRYIRERSGIIEQSINRLDANATWYSLEELESYLYYAKCEAKKSNKEINGIRFYFGVYPNDTATYQHKAGLTTIFLSPTMKRNNVLKNENKIQSLQARASTEDNVDVTEVQPLNFGGMGNPPKIEYPTNN